MKYETKFSRQIISVLIFSNMAGAGDHSRSLKEALVESLNAILSPIHNVRISGEEQVKALEVTEGNYYVTDTKLIDVSCNTCFFSFEKKKATKHQRDIHTAIHHFTVWIIKVYILYSTF